jgi:hypothetical protein
MVLIIGFAVTVNVVTGTVIASTVGTTVAAGVAAGTAGTTAAGNAVIAGNAAAGPYILVVLNQLQFMVLLNMISGDMPKFYESFSGGISWVMLGFNGSSFGVNGNRNLVKRDVVNDAEDQQNGMQRYARSIGLQVPQLFASFMIFFSIFAGTLLILYFAFYTFKQTQRQKYRKEHDEEEPKTFHNRLANIGLSLSRKGFGHLFLFAYVAMCALSVTQLFVADTLGNFFGALVLALVCTGFPIMLMFSILRPEYAFSQKILSYSEPIYNAFFKDVLCDEFKDSAQLAGAVKVVVKYLVGIFTGAIQGIPVTQTIVIMLVYIAELIYVMIKRPHKFMMVFWVNILASVVTVISLAIKVATAANPAVSKPGVGAALLILNGALVLLVLVGILGSQISKFWAKRKEKSDELKKKSFQGLAEVNTIDAIIDKELEKVCF